MASPNYIGDYAIVTPVKDEEKYIASTIESVLSQTVRPLKWVIVNDGSCDRTGEIIQSYVGNVDWISLITIDRDCKRNLGYAESRAFEVGRGLLRNQLYRFIVKLDGDLALPPEYFSQMLRHFQDNEQLGIASGVYLEEKDGEWQPIAMPAYHAAGAAKMVRTECFAAIGGFSKSPGWDTADEIKAWSKGWETSHFPELQFRHLKSEGSATGAAGTGRLHGEVYYVCGGGKLFFLLKVLQRMLFGKPFVLSGLSLLYGYLHAAAIRRPKLVTAQEQALYRRVLNERMFRRACSHPLSLAKVDGLAGKPNVRNLRNI